MWKDRRERVRQCTLRLRPDERVYKRQDGRNYDAGHLSRRGARQADRGEGDGVAGLLYG